MQFPDRGAITPLLEDVTVPPIARVSYDPPTPAVEQVPKATQSALGDLNLALTGGEQIGIAVGSRGIHDIVPVVETVVSSLREQGAEPVLIPAMGSHGGATAEGQQAVLAELGLTEEQVGCPIDDRMTTSVIAQASIGGQTLDVHVANAAIEADAVIPINRVKPHTSFSGRIESGLCKMVVVGLGKQPGARVFHRHGTTHGFVTVLERLYAEIRRAIDLPGGIGIVENAADRTARIVGIPGSSLIEREAAVLEQARSHLATLPFGETHLLIVDRIGKDISGTGMDTNVIGRMGRGAERAPTAPAIERIYARSLTEDSNGNGNGVGFADVIHRDLAEALDLQATYANALTSGNPEKAALPLVVPTDEQALQALVASLGAVPPDELRVAWIRDTSDLSTMWLSEPLFAEVTDPAVRLESWTDLAFADGRLQREAN